MSVCDLVRYVGWREYPELIMGIIIRKKYLGCELRYDVLWSDGRVGRNLYYNTLEAVCRYEGR